MVSGKSELGDGLGTENGFDLALQIAMSIFVALKSSLEGIPNPVVTDLLVNH